MLAHLVESLVIGLIGLWSMLYLTYRWLPFLWKPLLIKLVSQLKRIGYVSTANWFEKSLLTNSAGCGAGCSSCSPACSSQVNTQKAQVHEPQPVQWRNSK